MAQLLIDPQAQPVYIHCMTGEEVTGLAIVCLRKLQLIDHNFAVSEFSRYGRLCLRSPPPPPSVS